MFDHSLCLKRSRKAWFGALILGTLMWPGADARAQASDMQILFDRLERMERDIRTLNQQIARSASVPTNAAPAQATDPSSQPMQSAQPPAKLEYNKGEGALARVTVRLDSLEQEVRQATGLTEGMSYRIDQISARLDKLIADLDYRLGRLEGGTMGSLAQQPTVRAAPSPAGVSKVGEMAPPTSTQPSTIQGTVGQNGTFVPNNPGGGTLGQVSERSLAELTGENPSGDETPAPSENAPEYAPSAAQVDAAQDAQQPQASAEVASKPAPEPAQVSILPDGTPRERYQYAFGLMSQARYDDAEAAFKEFIKLHGDDALVGNARYWLGESYYVRKSFMDAAQTFFQAYQHTPQGPKAPDSLLKLGMSMGNLEKTEEACATYTKLRKEFAQLKPTIEKNLNREVKRLKCQ